jgi:pantoate--beta-alanine ligase
MKVFHTIAEFRAWRQSLPPSLRNPFVPTMGALHEGHASLVRQARAMAGDGAVTASIFVNPTQFGPSEDFTKYPRTLDADVDILTRSGCDAVFVPSAKEMYPAPCPTSNHSLLSTSNTWGATVEPGPLADILEGALRPGHFRGVCTVVLKLLNITTPTHLLMGQKDFQQQAILRRMCLDLNVPVEVITCPTVRETDGLAMSSRNRYLSPEDRSRAPAIYQAMQWARSQFDAGNRNTAPLEKGMKERIEGAGLEVQYVTIVHPDTLESWAQELTEKSMRIEALNAPITGPAVILVAAKLGPTRLIDNMLVPTPVAP